MRLTKILVRLQAKTLFQRMKSSPYFKLHRDLIILQSQGGHYAGELGDGNFPFPFQHYTKFINTWNALRDIHWEAHSFFSEISREVGISEADWTLEFDPKSSKERLWSYYNEGTAGMEGFVLGEFWRDLIRDEPNFARFYKPNVDYYPWLYQLGMQVKSGQSFRKEIDSELHKALLHSITQNRKTMLKTNCSRFYRDMESNSK